MGLQISKAKCPECPKVIEGLSQSAVKYNMQIHIRAKHEEKKK
ncbi:hypothetical protein LCGC14_2025230 [marine sediment metagenome]|uniref:HMA domain-containing protein n=1 Tax=marine sediment metagenome TaxID=412755 RepID=A0A0F9H9P8_9ZZZZ